MTKPTLERKSPFQNIEEKEGGGEKPSRLFSEEGGRGGQSRKEEENDSNIVVRRRLTSLQSFRYLSVSVEVKKQEGWRAKIVSGSTGAEKR